MWSFSGYNLTHFLCHSHRRSRHYLHFSHGIFKPRQPLSLFILWLERFHVFIATVKKATIFQIQFCFSGTPFVYSFFGPKGHISFMITVVNKTKKTFQISVTFLWQTVYMWWQKYSMEIWSKFSAYSTLFHASSKTLSQQPEVALQLRHRLMLATWWRHRRGHSVGHVTGNFCTVTWKRGKKLANVFVFVHFVRRPPRLSLSGCL